MKQKKREINDIIKTEKQKYLLIFFINNVRTKIIKTCIKFKFLKVSKKKLYLNIH